MSRITDFVQVRSDGNLAPSAMTVDEMLAQGWTSSLVRALTWTCDGEEISFIEPDGVHGTVVAGSRFIAAIAGGRLIVLSPDGSIHGELSAPFLSERKVKGDFGWFEPATSPAPDVFGVVFLTDDGDELRCDADAEAVTFLSVAGTRGRPT